MKIIKFIKDKKSLTYIIALAIVIIGCMWAFISASLITETFKNKISGQTYKNKEANISNLLVTETKDGVKSWELFAESGMYTDLDSIVLLEGIIGNFYDKNTVKASIKADKGTYNTEKKEIVLYDNVIMVYQDGTNIKAQRIEYKGKDSDIIAQGEVRIERPNEAVIIGNKAVLDKNYNDFHIEGRTKTQFYM